MSAAFGTLDHGILLSRFENVFGISGAALKWIASYLSDRSQVIDGEHSKLVLLKYGVPQVSVGLDFLTIFMQMTHSYTSHSSRRKEDAVKAQSLSLTENCLADIEGWMRTNMLKLNSDKTEVMLFTSKHNAIHMKNLGVIFNSALNMEQKLNNIYSFSYHQLRNIGHIRRYLQLSHWSMGL